MRDSFGRLLSLIAVLLWMVPGGRAVAADLSLTLSPPAVTVSDKPQTVTVTIAGAKDGDQYDVKVTDPGGGTLAPSKPTAASGAITLSLAPTIIGDWQVTASKGADSGTAKLAVSAPGQVCKASDNPDGAKQFATVSGYALLGLGVFAAILLIFLTIAAFDEHWSIADALAEESSVQPEHLNAGQRPIMVASASRLIAVAGMLVIVAIILQIGSAITWNLFVCGTVPPLGDLKTFLLAMAGIFLPYIANQVREMASPSNPPKPQTAAADGLKLTGVSPAVPPLESAPAVIRLFGSGFEQAIGISLADPQGNPVTVPAADVMEQGPTYLKINAQFTAGGDWKAVVTLPGGSSASLPFRVESPTPVLTGASAAVQAGGAAPARTVTIDGQFFRRNGTASFTPVAGVDAVTGNVRWVSDQRVTVDVSLSAGNWNVTVQNPGGKPSAPPQPLTI